MEAMTNSPTPTPFRFGLVAHSATPHLDWLEVARRAEASGYAVLLAPEVYPGPESTVALALAAGATTTLRVGNYVAATALHTPEALAWQASSLARLSGGRFELGLGVGRPDVTPAAESLAQPQTSAAERRRRLRRTIELLRELPGPHTPVLVATGGARGIALAGEHADIVALAVGPMTTRAEAAQAAQAVREQAAAHGRSVELALNIFGIGNQVSGWLTRMSGLTADDLRARDSLVMLPGDVNACAEELQRRRDELGTSYITVNLDANTPELLSVVQRLAGT